MPRFPKKEAEIKVLAARMFRGLWDNQPIYPNPPLNPAFLATAMNAFTVAGLNSVAAKAALARAAGDKDATLAALVDAMKDDLRYAENTTGFDDDKLKLIGWSGRKAKTPLAIPGQVRQLQAPKQGAGWVFLDWKKPADGGKPAAYKVQRRQPEVDDQWKTAATAIETEATLVDQPTGQQLEYRVIAINKAGAGTPSNTVAVRL